jgi:predicted small metal-binding protein
MPSIACRDAGIDCDFFFEAEDAGQVLVGDLRHAPVAHKKFMDDWAKGIVDGSGKLSAHLYTVVGLMKNPDTKVSRVACADFDLECAWTTSHDSVGRTIIDFVNHLETEHPDELMHHWMKKKWDGVADINAVIKR